MKRKVLRYFSLIVGIAVVLGIVQFISFGSLTGYVSLDDSVEWTFGENFGVGFMGYEINGGTILVKYLIEDFKDKDKTIDIFYGFDGSNIKKKEIFLGSGENLIVILDEKILNDGQLIKFNVNFNDGVSVVKDDINLVKNGRTINSFAVDGDYSNNNKSLSVYGIGFISLILSGFIFEFIYRGVRRKIPLKHSFNRKPVRRKIKIDI